MDLKETKYRSNLIHKGKIFDLQSDEVILPNGKTGIREIIRHPGGACVLAIDGKNSVYLVEQFRYAYNKSMLEIPAGKLEKNEDPKIAAMRELKEETGIVTKDIEFITKIYPTVGYTDEVIYLYLAKEFEIKDQNLDYDEFVNVICMPYEEALKKVISGEICDAKTQIALLMYNSI